MVLKRRCAFVLMNYYQNGIIELCLSRKVESSKLLIFDSLRRFREQFKVSESAVSHAVSRVSKTIAKDKKSAKKN